MQEIHNKSKQVELQPSKYRAIPLSGMLTRLSSTYCVEFPRRRSRRLTSQAAVDFFFRAASSFSMQSLTEFLMFIYQDIFKKFYTSGNERLVFWWRKKMKARAIGRLDDVTKLLQTQWSDSSGVCSILSMGEPFLPFPRSTSFRYVSHVLYIACVALHGNPAYAGVWCRRKMMLLLIIVAGWHTLSFECIRGLINTLYHCGHSAEDRKRKLLTKYASLDNLICYVCQNFANAEIAAMSIES